jgi:methionine synthase II (cobalamin-independent)
MTTTSSDRLRTGKPPFRANHVGSLLRPDALKQARERLLGADTAVSNLGPHDNTALREVEDTCIREAVAMQEPADTLLRRIEKASRFVEVEQLALSPQCGFASSVKGHPLTEADQRAKLERIVEPTAHGER